MTNDIRLAVDSGKVALGNREVVKAIRDNTARLVIAASKNKEMALQDIQHLSKVSSVPSLVFQGNPVELGAVCGKPYSISMLAIIEPGDSKILQNLGNQ